MQKWAGVGMQQLPRSEAWTPGERVGCDYCFYASAVQRCTREEKMYCFASDKLCFETNFFHLSSWWNICAARWEFCFLTDVLVDISSGFTVYRVSRQTVPNTCGTLDHGWQLDLLVLQCCFHLTWWLIGIASFSIHQSLPVLSCGISCFEAAAGSLLMMPALAHMGGIHTSSFPMLGGNRKTQGTWGQRNARIRWNSWVLQHAPDVPGHTLWLGGKGAVPKCAAKPDAGKAVMCQLRLWWRKKCWLLWLLKILTLWCLDGQGLVNCATGWVTVCGAPP